MLNIKDIIRLPDPRKNVKAEVKEVVHEWKGRNSIYIRVRLTGWHFPERALEPFMVIGNAISQFVRISNEGSVVDAYFSVVPPVATSISFGYGKVISWDFDVAIDIKNAKLLDRSRLPENTIDPFSKKR